MKLDEYYSAIAELVNDCGEEYGSIGILGVLEAIRMQVERQWRKIESAAQVVVAAPSASPNSQSAPCQHEYGDMTTGGRSCRKCGHTIPPTF